MSNVDERALPAQPASPGLARQASLLALGNVASRLLGLVREMVIANYFGARGEVSAFRVASQTPTLLYDFLIGGMLSAALVPVLSDYAQRSRSEFARLIGILLSAGALMLALVVVLLEIAAPELAWLLAAGFRNEHPALLELTTELLRLSLPLAWVLGMTGLLTAILYAQQRFTMPALATALFNLGLVVTAPLLVRAMGIHSLVIGLLVGGLAQLWLLGWELHRCRLGIRPLIWWRHPALGKIVRLYAPIALGLVVSLFQVGLDRRLASSADTQAIAWMANATTLQQMPLGLISVAIALAALPRLSQYYAGQDDERFRQTLGRGLRMVLLLMAPAAVGLWLLGAPLTRLLFERGEFVAQDTRQVVAALHIYVLGMLFAAVDFPLNYAFYARNNTWLPALVGVLSVGVYMVVAFVSVAPLGYLGLVWADTAKQASHALVMLLLLAGQVGGLGGQTRRGLPALLLGALVMAGVIGGGNLVLATRLGSGAWADLLTVALLGGLGLLAYGATLYALRVHEVQEVVGRLREVVRGKT
jgi:putative peptidoglycan lipid II flippase